MTTLGQEQAIDTPPYSPSPQRWALLLLVIILLAGGLRFWQLGDLPAGLYRDEAFNGLDASQVLEGQYALFFVANNGREPAYIYLTALAVWLFGRTAFAVRFTAALVGTLTTWFVYQLGKIWFHRSMGLLVAWVWATTLWSVHLSRIGFRTILMVPILTSVFWLGTLAYRQRNRYLWLLAGIVYGCGFYTYLAIRFTPVLLVGVALWLWLKGKHKHLFPDILWFGLGSGLALLPFVIGLWQMPALLLGRSGQVSIFHSDINQGDLWRTWWRHVGQAIGMFFWQGDTILRHNPVGRPVFDPIMSVMSIIGLIGILKQWRHPVFAILCLWIGIMLFPTILAEDAPHFLRAVGVLPAILFLPALGLYQLWHSMCLPHYWRQGLVLSCMALSLLITMQDYMDYVDAPETGYLFEKAYRDLAEQVSQDAGNHLVWVEKRLVENSPTFEFLVQNSDNVHYFHDDAALPIILTSPTSVYLWPHTPHTLLWTKVTEPTRILAERGSLARGDLEEAPYLLFTHYQFSVPSSHETLAKFGQNIILQQSNINLIENHIAIDLSWHSEKLITQTLTTFIHVVGSEGLIGQSDSVPGQGFLPASQWQPHWFVEDRHLITLSEPFDPHKHKILIGLYQSQTGKRLPVFSPNDIFIGDVWQLVSKP